MDYSNLPIQYKGIYACKLGRDAAINMGFDDYDERLPTKIERIFGVASGKKIDQPMYLGLRFIQLNNLAVKQELFESEIFQKLELLKKDLVMEDDLNILKVTEVGENRLTLNSDVIEIKCYFYNAYNIKATYFNKKSNNEFDHNLKFVSWWMV